eukprot:3687006-Rhodomonas_salina.1
MPESEPPETNQTSRSLDAAMRPVSSSFSFSAVSEKSNAPPVTDTSKSGRLGAQEHEGESEKGRGMEQEAREGRVGDTRQVPHALHDKPHYLPACRSRA